MDVFYGSVRVVVIGFYSPRGDLPSRFHQNSFSYLDVPTLALLGSGVGLYRIKVGRFNLKPPG